LLLDYRFLEAKLNATDVSALIEDCRSLLSHGKDEPIRLIQSALQMSSHVLDKDKKALAHQLAGRLMHYYTKIDEIRASLDVVMKTPNNLFPLNPDSKYDIMNPAGGMLLRTLAGHTDIVNGAVQLRDGRILSWSKDNTLRLWQPNGTPIVALTRHTDSVWGAIELKDGRLLSWSADKTLRLWDLDGAFITSMTGHTNHVRGAIQLTDGRILSWSGGGTLHLWSKDGVFIMIIIDKMIFNEVQVQLQDERIWSWGRGRHLYLWVLDSSGDLIKEWYRYEFDIFHLYPLADGRLLTWNDGLSWTGEPYTFDIDYNLRLLDRNEKSITTITGHTDRVIGAIQLSDGRLLSWSQDSTLRLWNEDGSIPLATLTGHTSEIYGVIELSDGRLLSWSKDSTLRLWSKDGSMPLATLSGHTNDIYGVIELSDGRLLSWSKDSTLRLWDGGGNHITILKGHTKSVHGTIKLNNGRVLSWSEDSTLRLWDANQPEIVTLTEHKRGVNNIIELSDGRLLSWSRDNTLRLWQPDGTPIATLTGHTDRVNGAVQLADGRILSWGSDTYRKNPEMRLWDTDGTPLDVLEQYYDSGNREIIGAWAKKYGYTLDDFYPRENKQNTFMAGGHVQWKYDSTDLIITDPQTGAKVYTFYGDAPFSGGVVVLDGGRIIVAGDSIGRVLFLRWVGEDGV